MADTPDRGEADDQFDDRYFERLAAARRHWWVEGMVRIGVSLLDERGTALQVLDAGCGSGALTEWLSTLAAPHPVVGTDVAWAGLAHAQRAGPAAVLAQASLVALPFAADHFDVVVTTDVLQHLTRVDEAAALGEIARVLRPGGRVLVRTNARSGRSTVEERDDWRLYTPVMLRASLEGAGLVVDALTPVNAVQGLWASVSHRRRPTDHHDHHDHHDDVDGESRPEWGTAGLGIPTPTSAWRNRLLLGLLQAEARWLRGGRRRLPFGHSIYAVARRPDGPGSAGSGSTTRSPLRADR